MTGGEQEARHEAVVMRMERMLRSLAGHKRVRHAVLGVASLDGSLAWSGAVGQARPDGSEMRPETPWFLASVTKLYIATTVLRLHESGAVDINAPITSCLPRELARGLHVIDGVDRTARITPRHLLGHLSGLPDWLDERPRSGRSLLEEVMEDGDRAWSVEEAVGRARDRLVAHFPPSDPHAPRPRIRYSDTNYQLLMVIAQNVTGAPMGRIYRQTLFDRLGLRRTWLLGDEAPEDTGEPATVWLGDRPFADRPLALRSFGDLYATVDDVLRFGRALFRSEIFDDPATARLMWGRFTRFGLPRGAAALRAPSWPIEYGLGMMRFDLPRWLYVGRRLPALTGHTGSTGSWLWHCAGLGLVSAGTVDQTAAATVPFRAVPRAFSGLPR